MCLPKSHDRRHNPRFLVSVQPRAQPGFPEALRRQGERCFCVAPPRCEGQRLERSRLELLLSSRKALALAFTIQPPLKKAFIIQVNRYTKVPGGSYRSFASNHPNALPGRSYRTCESRQVLMEARQALYDKSSAVGGQRLPLGSMVSGPPRRDRCDSESSMSSAVRVLSGLSHAQCV